jgi:hypothetical protein
METKWLSIQSFQQNQSLIELISKFLIHIKLTTKGIISTINEQEISDAKEAIKLFLKSLNKAINDLEAQAPKSLLGIDSRQKSLIQSFTEAKKNKQKFKSKLFRTSPQFIIDTIDNQEFSDELISSLSELRTLLNDHITIDFKNIVLDI